MDPFRLGLRNLMGVFAPGAFLVLVAIYTLYYVNWSLGWTPDVGEHGAVLLLAALFLVSYLFGNVLRLNSADRVDKESARVLQNELTRSHHNELAGLDHDELNTTPGRTKKGITQEAIAKKLDATWELFGPNAPAIKNLTSGGGRDDVDVIWRLDHFPYPVWHFFKLCLFHRPEAYMFFRTYQDCMRHKESPEKLGKEFFNFCKTTIHHAQRDLGDALTYEIQDAEAQVRFFAGTYYTLFYGQVMLGVLLLSLLIQIVFHGWLALGPHVPSRLELVLTSLGASALLIATYMMRFIILKRFRTLRLKEVDLVYDAFYLLHRHPAPCSDCSTTPAEHRGREYDARAKLVKEAFDLSANQGEKARAVGLEELVRLMKSESKKEQYHYLSSLYFAGADIDHPYFLQNTKVAAGLAVLPEDKEKAGTRKEHPHQTEVVFVLDGSLVLEQEIGHKPSKEILNGGDVRVIGPGVCHWISGVEGQDSAYLFVKTNPAEDPREMPCGRDLEAQGSGTPDAGGDASGSQEVPNRV